MTDDNIERLHGLANSYRITGDPEFAAVIDALLAERERWMDTCLALRAERLVIRAECNESRAERDALRAEVERLIDVLYSNGFVRCDISACNCGSWHARYGLRERFEEIKDALSEATDLNGKTVLSALNEVINERDALARDAARYRWLRQPNPLHREAHIAVLTHNGGWVASEEKADAAIDAAMKGASDES